MASYHVSMKGQLIVVNSKFTTVSLVWKIQMVYFIAFFIGWAFSLKLRGFSHPNENAMTQVFSACWSISQHCNGVFIYFSYNLTPVVIEAHRNKVKVHHAYRQRQGMIACNNINHSHIPTLKGVMHACHDFCSNHFHWNKPLLFAH